MWLSIDTMVYNKRVSLTSNLIDARASRFEDVNVCQTRLSQKLRASGWRRLQFAVDGQKIVRIVVFCECEFFVCVAVCELRVASFVFEKFVFCECEFAFALAIAVVCAFACKLPLALAKLDWPPVCVSLRPNSALVLLASSKSNSNLHTQTLILSVVVSIANRDLLLAICILVCELQTANCNSNELSWLPSAASQLARPRQVPAGRGDSCEGMVRWHPQPAGLG